MKRLKRLCDYWFVGVDYQIEPITGSGSNRQYYRAVCADGRSTIGVVGTSYAENVAFLTLAKHFKDKQLPVPEVYAVSDDKMCYIQQDLGSTALFDCIKDVALQGGEYTSEQKKLLVNAMSLLPDFQFRGAEGLDFNVCYPQSSFDERMISFDLNYFKYCFLKSTGLDFSEIELDDDFQLLTTDLLSLTTDTFMYRDFQARNVMIVDGFPYFIDFQGGRCGPYYYDVASFVWQAKAAYSTEMREQLIKTYIESLKRYVAVDEVKFRRNLNLFVLFRTLQVLGAYGFRGYFERKEHFLQSIPYAIANLRELLKDDNLKRYKYLHRLLNEMANLPQLQPQVPKARLEIEICSFSYKNGLPEDSSSNGGGYIFDCRAMRNPGRYPEYKHLTGRDAEVIDFLEHRGEVFVFLDSVYALVDKHIERYLCRGFTHLMVAFGCTGGQHRSVYCADHLAKHIRQKYNVDIKLYHREQNF